MGAMRNVRAAAVVAASLTAIALFGSSCSTDPNSEAGPVAGDGGLDTGTADTGAPAEGGGLDTGTPDPGDGGPVAANCAPAGDGRTNCGSASESCCTTLPVTGGTFSRSYDGINYTDPQYGATVADFRLDKYEVTVGRFRAFVGAVVGGWTPPPGSGKHAHVNGGSGLAASGLPGGNEPGWDTAWNTTLPSSAATWDSPAYLACNPASTWTPAPASNERRPINCIDWYQALAFCIWDGGFLPSEAEWNYAAAGGSEQRAYPWSSAYPPGSSTISAANAVYGGGAAITEDVGSKSPAGNGRYGQTDLAGNVWEWALDWYKTPYNETSCTNCAHLVAGSFRVIRGGSLSNDTFSLTASLRYGDDAPTVRYADVGARCARTP